MTRKYIDLYVTALGYGALGSFLFVVVLGHNSEESSAALFILAVSVIIKMSTLGWMIDRFIPRPLPTDDQNFDRYIARQSPWIRMSVRLSFAFLVCGVFSFAFGCATVIAAGGVWLVGIAWATDLFLTLSTYCTSIGILLIALLCLTVETVRRVLNLQERTRSFWRRGFHSRPLERLVYVHAPRRPPLSPMHGYR